MKPTHEHDCEKCRYLGTVTSKHRIGTITDLYTCDDELIARYSDNAPDYSSMYLWQAQGFQHTNLDLLEAYHRSQTKH